MLKQKIKQIMLRRAGIDIDGNTLINMGGQYHFANRNSPFRPRIAYSMISGDMTFGEGVSIDSARVFGNMTFGRFSNVNGPGTVVESFINPITIGAFSSVAMNCLIIDSNHRIDRASSFCFQHTFFGAPYGDDLTSKGPVVIEEDVWIGTGVAVVGGGITIGRGAVIAAGAVITKNVEPYTIVGGVPGKVIGRRFSDRTIQVLEDSKWYEWDIEKIKANQDFFTMQRD